MAALTVRHESAHEPAHAGELTSRPRAERQDCSGRVTDSQEGLVTTILHALDVLRRFSATAGPLGEQWLEEQEKHLGPTQLGRGN